MIDKNIRIRAHHGMCLAFFQGKGYSDEFTKHMQNILDLMKENPQVQIAGAADVVCSKCPNLKEGRCVTQDLVQEYDRQVMLRCGLEENASIRWGEFSKLVREKILLPGKREEICGNCEWSKLCQFPKNCK